MSNDYVRLIKYFPQVSDQLAIVMFVLLIARVIGKAIRFYFPLAHPLNGKPQDESISFHPDSISLKETPDGGQYGGCFNIYEGNARAFAQ